MSKIEENMKEMKESMRRMEQMILSFAGSTPAVAHEKKRLATIIDFQSRQVIRPRECSGQ